MILKFEIEIQLNKITKESRFSMVNVPEGGNTNKKPKLEERIEITP
jgi:hypothetical protein